MDKSDDFATPAPRKRRRKAVSNGAADDCFTCANRNAKCDRRRPYCTQCLALGVQCSGYKTTLTWGVGVASRGKLRGLSWPVSGSQQAASATVAASTRKAAESERHPFPSPARPRPALKKSTARSPLKRTRIDRLTGKTNTTATTAPLQHVDATLSSQPGPIYHISASSRPSMRSAQLSQGEDKSSLLVNSAAAVLSNPYHGSTTVPFRRHGGELAYPTLIPCVSYLDGSTAQPTISNGEFSSVSPNLTSRLRGFSSRIEGNQNHVATSEFGDHPLWPRKTVLDTSSEGAWDKVDVNFHNEPLSTGSKVADYSLLNEYHQVSNTQGQTLFVPQPISSQLIGRTPRMQYLISYYAEVISPVIVAFDSPANPYRMFILELAKNSDTLQHALAALSLSNLRQRKKHWGLSAGKTLPARKSSSAHCRMAGLSCEEGFGPLGHEEQHKEASFHKAMAITSLNAQLAHPTQRLADSVLATVLVLCLFNMCDTGVAKFQQQLAGVKKLLALQRSANRNCSDLVKWYIRMFVWFDVMTATINNRECELKGDYLDIAVSGHDDWALANLAGCDATMFKMISQLDHLNMLSQEKATEPYSVNEWPPIATAPLPPDMIHHTPMPPPVDEPDGATNPLPIHWEDTISTDGSDSRADFWREWHALRQRLESWHLQLREGRSLTDSATINTRYPYFLSSPLTPAHLSPTNLSDLANISESFRYSALLYLERLASPHLPSSHPRIQRLVYTSLHYISAVKSDVYLLWPLFVTGAECTLDAHRALIRQCCADIQKDSGFINNLASLGLLEKIWAENSSSGGKSGTQLSPPTTAFADVKRSKSPGGLDDADTRAADGTAPGFLTQKVPLGGEAFKWRRIMDLEGSDVEYIVV